MAFIAVLGVFGYFGQFVQDQRLFHQQVPNQVALLNTLKWFYGDHEFFLFQKPIGLWSL